MSVVEKVFWRTLGSEDLGTIPLCMYREIENTIRLLMCFSDARRVNKTP